jgi:hypothetical protein
MWRRSAISFAAGMAYIFWPRKGDLRGFDPKAVARLETAMWQHYYQRAYFKLFRALYSLNREVYHFSPWDSARLSYYAARAARSFQSSRSRKKAQRALPLLERYYDILRQQGGEQFDVTKTARLELDWWQLRRESAGPSQYGEVIAQVQEELFSVRGNHVKQAASLRAEMMDYRDKRHDGKMQSQDWAHIDDGLLRSYQLLKTVLNTASGQKRTKQAWDRDG